MRKKRKKPALPQTCAALLTAAALLIPVTADAGEQPPSLRLAMVGNPAHAPYRQPVSQTATDSEENTGSWSFTLDNDALVPGSRDQDYTYGLSVAATGTKARDFALSLDTPLGWIDRGIGVDGIGNTSELGHSFEAGLFGFTPEDKSIAAPQYDDRPYASLLYASSSRIQVNPQDKVAWHSTLTVGALGLDLAGNLQNSFHKAIGSEHAEGWKHQISDGGEPTARYSLARQKTLPFSTDNLEVKSTVEGSVGYITEARWSLSFRAGKLRAPWWQSNPELARYGERNSTNSMEQGSEHYLWGGISLVGRAYNVFLQGQFRDSDVSYDSDEINHAIAEAWLGYTWGFGDGYRLSYVLRGHTSELKEGVGDRNVLWGGLVFAKSF